MARGSRYKGCPLIEEFKWGMNGSIRRKLIEVEKQLAIIEHWFKRAIALDRNWRESRREEERLKGTFEQSLPWPQVWPRRQETPQQRVPTGPAPMEGMERTNAAMATP